MKRTRKKIVLVGGGGHCRACIDVIEQNGTFIIAGVVDVKPMMGRNVLGYKITASDDDLPGLVRRCKNFLITIGQIESPHKRIETFEFLKQIGAGFPVIISPSAHVSRYAAIGEGTIVMHGAIVNANAKIGRNCIINTAAVIEHDSNIGDHCHISTGSIVNGGCLAGEGVFIGSKAVISNNVNIPGGTVIGAGSVVLRSIAEKGTYAGSPVRQCG